MKQAVARIAAAVGLCVLVVLPAAAGTLSGTVESAAGVPAANTAVWLVAPNIDAKASGVRAVLDQRDMHFLPHMLAVQVGTTVAFQNHDTVVHNVFSPDPCAGAFNLGNWGPGGARSHTFDQECRATILCSLHADMEAFIAVVPTPYFAVTGPDGRYRISGVPAGTYTLKAWAPDDTVDGSARVVVSGETTKNVSLQ